MNIGDLKLMAPQSWLFHPFDRIILARPDSGVGSLQISTAFRRDLHGDISPSACLDVARQFVSHDGMSEPFDTIERIDAESLFGGFSYTVGDEFGRVWYRFVQHQLLLGVYHCSAHKTAEAASELQEAEQIMQAAEYATPSI
jgi:hypothetical protein